MLLQRDFEKNPYSADEQRVVDYLAKLVPEIGAGDDPIGFLIASHAAIVHDRMLKDIEEGEVTS